MLAELSGGRFPAPTAVTLSRRRAVAKLQGSSWYIVQKPAVLSGRETLPKLLSQQSYSKGQMGNWVKYSLYGNGRDVNVACSQQALILQKYKIFTGPHLKEHDK